MEPQPSSDRVELVNRIFADALDLPAAERAAFVRESAAGDVAVLDSVTALLAQHSALGSFLEAPAFGVPAPAVRFAAGALVSARFRVISSLGRGGMGEVYRAEDLELGETIALKTLRLRGDESLDARFRDEIRLARRIAHPNVCRIFDLFVEHTAAGEILYFTMEYLEGPTLAQRLKQGALPAESALAIARQVAAGLEAAHALGIVHRDLKPANIILTPEKAGGERAVITDFGLAKALELDGSDAGQTATGQILGTPDYMAPEQFLGAAVTPATDVFALGLILYEMVAGCRAFPSENAMRSAIRRMTEAPDPPSLAAEGVPPHWSRAIARALSAKPEQRYQSARELVERLEAPLRWGDRLPVRKISRRAMLTSAGVVAGGLSSYLAISRINEYRLRIPDKPLVMLTPLSHSTSASDGALSASALDELLANQLQQSRHVETLSRDRMEAVWKRIGGENGGLPAQLTTSQARHIAMRAGAQFVVFGNLARVGDEHVLQLKLELMGADTGNPRKTWPGNEPRNFSVRAEASLPSAVHAGADWIRTTVGESSAELSNRNRPPEELTTPSWPALREFTQANEAWRKNAPEEAVGHLQDALRLDPEFALAQARLADLLIASGRRDEGLPLYSVAADALGKKNLTDRESLRIRGSFALDTGQNAEAEHVFSRYATEYPDDALPLFYKAKAVDSLDREEEGLELSSTAMKRQPDSAPFVLNHAARLIGAGKIDEADALCRTADSLGERDAADRLRCAIALARLHAEGAWRAIERVRTQGVAVARSTASLLAACLHAEQGRWQEAERLAAETAVSDARMEFGRQRVFAAQRLRARILLHTGGRAEAARVCREMLAKQPGYEEKMQVGCLLAQSGDLSGARACRIANLPQWPCYLHWVVRLQGELALAEGDPAKAHVLFRASPPSQYRNEWPEYRMRAALAAGDRDTAAGLLRELMRRYAFYWFLADWNGPGFLAWGLGLTGQLSLPADDLATARRIRERLGLTIS
ncbi:MAG TPA: protein kinase [Candidatus Acidoferrum sp.]|nr:protein kinase [Candidatus Acidoferrum sp.]